MLRRGEDNRSYGSTTMNAESSRSHTIYRLVIESTDVDEYDDDVTASANSYQVNNSASSGPQRLSYLNLVDLAGMKYSSIT